MEITSADEKTELEVRQIENFIVWGTLADSDELKDITEYVKFTDEEGNELENMNETVGTAEGKGAGKKFPKTNEDFYIKVDYNSPIYTQVVAINSLEVSFKELDVRAVGYKLSEVIVHYTEWKSNNIMWQHCTVKHEYEEETTEYDSISGQWITTTETKTETETKDDHLKGNCSMGESPTCTSHDNCTITVTHEDITASPSEGILLEGETDSSTYAQMLFLLHKAELYWRRYKLVVLFGPENQNPPSDMTPPPYTPPATETPDIPHRTYIDIGGNVWVDAEETKEGTGTNGTYDEGTNDYPRKNVKVTLYFENGTMVKESDVAEWARKDFKNPTYTDEKGRYDFYQLPMDKKYYVEFTYDGMTYTTVDFLKDGTVSDYKVNSNKDIYKINSKAEEQKGKRQDFNNRFAEILGKGPSYYSGEKTTGETRSGEKLVYKTKIFDKNLQSRLLTTTDEKDVERLWNNDPNDREIGTARPGKEEEKSKYTGENYEMTVTTKDRELIYPFGVKEYIIWEAENNINKLEYLKHINLGLKRRPTADFRLAVDLKAGATTIKDKEKVVFYKPSQKLDDLTIDATEHTDEYIKQEISASDYNWKKEYSNIYGDASTGFKIVDDQLNVYVLYKIVLANQCELENYSGVITGIVDYYDDRLEMVPDKDKNKVSELFNFEKLGFTVPKGAISWVEKDNTEVKWKTLSSSTSGYTAIETDGLNLKLEKSGDTKAIYLILKVKDNGDVLYNGVEDNQGNKQGIQNIAEIKSYKVLDENGEPAGLVDCDSAPYNATPGKKETYEDDTDNAPMFQLILNWEPRKISGNVWDNKIVEETAQNNAEPPVQNVEVELIEYVYKDGKTTEVVRPGLKFNGNSVSVNRNENIRTDSNGNYEFYVEGGNYAIRFTYGDTVMLETNKQYNAQDYFAAQKYTPLSEMTEYQQEYSKAFATVKSLEEYLANADKLEIDLSDYSGKQSEWESENWSVDTKNNLSNARDNSTIRAEVIKNAVDINYNSATLLNKLNKDANLTSTDATELSGADNTKAPNYTYMEAMSDIVIIASNDLVETEKVINLGLQERPKASMKLEKEVTKIVVKTNDGRELINTDDASKLNNLQKLDEIQRVFINMDTKSMEGATIDIDYKIIVTNDSEKDDVLQNYVYVQEDEAIMDNLANELNEKYFKEPELNRNSKLPIRANSIYDYVNINLEYREDDNKDKENGDQARWEIVFDDNNTNKPPVNKIEDGTLKDEVKETLGKDNRVVSKVLKTQDWVNQNLTAGEDYKIPIYLGITLSEDINDDNPDALVYSNCAEIIQIFSGAGRRDYDIIPGNYVPYEDPKEPDEKWTGTSTVTPPLGENRAVYIVLPIISIGIVIIGIILIKKKVLKK